MPSLLALHLLAGCAPSLTAGRAAPAPAPEREFRGVWVASVSNIDWPSRPGLPADSQRAELVRILDRARALHLNAVILQVRPGADALYASPHEPWSEYLTGEMGRAPEPFYDPLAFAVEEAHRRGLELHAWFNPYRARHPSARSPISPEHLSRARPELVRGYGTHLWMDPGEPEVQEHTLKVILDVVRRYDVDGVHIDDYFYPYRERDAAGREIPFPDSASYAAYRERGGRLERDDWRRSNVDRLVERLHRGIRDTKPWVKFGISPFGLWRPGYPPQIQGFDAYQQLYADSRLWLRRGWVDYFTPQLYWPIAQTAQSYPVLLRWWSEQNVHARHLWPGNFTSRVGSDPVRGWRAAEVLGQIYATRGQAGAGGNVHFSMRVFLQNPDSLNERLLAGAYPAPALVPATPWMRAPVPATPRVSGEGVAGVGVTLRVEPGDGREVWLWSVRTRSAGAWRSSVVPGWRREIAIEGVPDRILVAGVSRTGALGPARVAIPTPRPGGAASPASP